MASFCFINGEIKSTNDAVIGITDLALRRGYGVFDYFRTYDGKLFHFNEHLKRLQKSASQVHLKLPFSDEKLKEIVNELIVKNSIHNCGVRIILTGGYFNSTGKVIPNIIITIEELPFYHEEYYAKGVSLLTYEFQRELPDVKSVNYLNDIRLNQLRKKNNAYEILYHSNNYVSECPRSNFFIFINNILVTPNNNILKGITRQIVLDLASKHWNIKERTLNYEELNQSDEAFITSTTKGIMPVTTIDGKNVGNGKAGKQTIKLMKLFEEHIANYNQNLE